MDLRVQFWLTKVQWVVTNMLWWNCIWTVFEFYILETPRTLSEIFLVSKMHSLTATIQESKQSKTLFGNFQHKKFFAGSTFLNFVPGDIFSECGNTKFSRYLKRIYCEYPAIHWKHFLSCVKMGEQGKTKPFKTFKCFISYFPVLNLVNEYEKNV